ncbi:MAG: protein rep [Bacteroidetes bacterium]|nr:protein rep [Bacteroidota bacterium]
MMRILLNTLAQRGTEKPEKVSKKKKITVTGKGADLSKTNQMNGWAKRKSITQKILLALIDIAKEKGAFDRVEQYWNAYYCLSRAYSSEGRLFGKYCKNKFCTVCLCIRKAEILNKYLPILKNWNDAYFVTLTIKAIPYERLSLLVCKLVEGFEKISDKYRKRTQRGRGNSLMGIRSLECNFNPIMKTYNPHFHIIVPTKEIAIILINEWVKLWKDTNGTKWTTRAAQNMRKVQNIERDLIECVKYGTKIFTEPDINKKSKQSNNPTIYVSAFDNIIAAMKGHRLFDRFGFNLPKNSNANAVNFQSLNDYDEWVFDSAHSNWINADTEEALSEYKLPIELNLLLSNNLNLSLQ